MAKRELDFSEIKKKRNRRRNYVRVFLFSSLAVGFLFACSWLLFRSPVFRVERVEVIGAEQVPQEEILEFLKRNFSSSLRTRFFGFENMLGWPNGVAEQSLKLFPAVQEIELRKRYGSRTIEVEVKERKPLGIWCAKKDAVGAESGTIGSPVRCAWFDEEGLAFRESIEAEGSLLVTVSDYSDGALAIGSKVLPEALVPNIVSILKVLSSADVRVAEVRLNDLKAQEIEVLMHDGPALYFSLRFPADAALPVIQKLLSSQGGKKLEYIDFRVENRAYYK